MGTVALNVTSSRSILQRRLGVCYAWFVVNGAEENNLMSDKPTNKPIPKPADPVWLTDENERFDVPRKYAKAIQKAVPKLRLSFERIGGKYLGRVAKNPKRKKAKRGGKPIDFSQIGGKRIL